MPACVVRCGEHHVPLRYDVYFVADSLFNVYYRFFVDLDVRVCLLPDYCYWTDGFPRLFTFTVVVVVATDTRFGPYPFVDLRSTTVHSSPRSHY